MPFYFDDSLETPEENEDDSMLTLAEHCAKYGRRERILTPHELQEIKDAEGYKPAPAVAKDFQIGVARVRQVWDGRHG